ncbi:MAG: DNA adenine methylase [Leptolyngbyaceae cyanobacterium]
MTVALSTTLYPRPFLKWAGGKGRLIQQYQPYFPQQIRRYYEPFLGGGAIFFHLSDRFGSAMLADINAELVNVYQCVQRQVEPLIQRLQEHHSRHEPDYYYDVRAQALSDPLGRAARLIYLNKTCFNGLYRENAKGCFNVPIGRYKNPKICDSATLRLASEGLQRSQIICDPFDAVLEQAWHKDDFVYFDPPYHPISTTSSFTRYNRYGFTVADQTRLRDTFVELAKRGVKVMLSNSDCEFIRELYEGFPMREIQAARAINVNARRRGKISELLITSYIV